MVILLVGASACFGAGRGCLEVQVSGFYKDKFVPIGFAEVELKGRGEAFRRVVSGRTLFQDLDTGQYELEVKVNWTVVDRRLIEVQPGWQSVHVQLRYNNSIVGTVLSDAGNPLQGLKVELLGLESGRFHADAISDENGRFRFEEVIPGEYYVTHAVLYSPTLSIGDRTLSDPPYGRSWYPGSATVEGAQVVEVSADQAIVLDPWTPGGELTPCEVKGRIVTSEGRSIGETIVTLRVSQSGPVAAVGRSREDGSFSLPAVEELEYEISAGEGDEAASQPIGRDCGRRDVIDLVLDQ